MNTLRRTACVPALRTAAVTAAVLASLGLAACSGGDKDKPASQVAAKVNKEEISVHQINYLLQRQPGLKPEQAESASKTALERLIDQELAVQKAEELKLDRDPRVVQALDAARREILSRFYFEKVAEGVAKPTPEEVREYYRSKPALFSERRIYSLQEIAIQAPKEQVPELEQQLKSAKTPAEFVEQLKAKNIPFAVNQVTRAAEQLPLSMLDSFHALKDGQAMFVPSPSGAQVLVLQASRSAPVDEERARAAIEQYLMNERKRKLVEGELKDLRKSAQIEYVGKFADASGGAAQKTEVAPAAKQEAKPNSDADAISKGLSGLK